MVVVQNLTEKLQPNTTVFGKKKSSHIKKVVSHQARAGKALGVHLAQSSHFTDKKTEAQTGWADLPKSHPNFKYPKIKFEPWFSDS